ncbi:MAG: hypothetical protein MI892_05820 [Desulfobacterales bacterium]|nr:hypothetical protein [Desulfobacterales bacterium]
MPRIRLAIGLYSCRTADSDRHIPYLRVNPDATVRRIIELLDTQLVQFNGFIRESGIPKFGVRGIFVAPEYMFAFGDGTGHPRGVPDYMKDRILKSLKELSRKHDGIVLIPGSIAWNTSVTGRGTANISAGGNLSVSEITAELPIIEAKRLWADARVMDQVGRDADRGARKTARSDLLKNTGGNRRLQKNSVPVFHNGKLVCIQDKASDYHESSRPSHLHVSVPHPGTFEIRTHKGPLRIGVEVCLDHNIGALRRAIAAGAATPHIHAIASAAVVPNADHFQATQNGGLVIHASSQPAFMGTWRMGGAVPAMAATPGMTDFTAYWRTNRFNPDLINGAAQCTFGNDTLVTDVADIDI